MPRISADTRERLGATLCVAALGALLLGGPVTGYHSAATLVGLALAYPGALMMRLGRKFNIGMTIAAVVVVLLVLL
jgi:hypothetical protein